MLADGYRGGNSTFGPHRKGYKGGRKPLYDPLTPVWHPPVALDESHYATAIYVGCGSISKGVKLALEHIGKSLAHCPETRVAVKALVRSSRIAVRHDVARALAIPASRPAEVEVTQSDLEEWER